MNNHITCPHCGGTFTQQAPIDSRPMDLRMMAWRQANRYSKVQAAKLIGCTDEAYRAWEEGNCPVSAPWQQRIEQVMRDAIRQ
jgi:DNA-binding XRE family transcriptional regulator